jgi:hypothetical protein
MGKILQFKSCAVGGEYNGLGAATPSSYGYISVQTPANIVNHINSCYANDVNLAGKVTGIGYGWQKYVVPSSGKVKFIVRGAAGGATGKSGYTINPITGAVSGSGNRPGRGAKIVGISKLKKDDILYILVGMRGWCNNGGDWGSGGGGASVVLKDNPSGTYTFSPLNRKVDVLFVAGGGGGCFDSSFGSAYYGGDAVVTNGTNTNGGSASGGSGGAGLTGNGAKGNGPSPSYSLLSGSVFTNALYAIHYGGWGGGGCPYDGGGAGAGYSGGNALGNSKGGAGGTSYINPNLCEEVSRGYATVDADSGRNLTNPWTAYGFVELELGRDEGKFILAKDSGGYKYFDGAECIDGSTKSTFTNQWQLLTSQSIPEEDTYKEYGNCIINNRIGLLDDVRFLVMSKEPKETINISGHINGALIEQIQDVSISDISLIKSITSTHNTENLDVRFAMSKNNGKTWQTYNSGSWDDIDIHNKQEFMNNGWSLSQFVTIPLEDWNSYKAKTIRFAACITQNGPNGKTILDNIREIADLVGSWRHFKESEAQYEYISDTELKVTFLEGGNYKVNYLDQLNPTTVST